MVCAIVLRIKFYIYKQKIGKFCETFIFRGGGSFDRKSQKIFILYLDVKCDADSESLSLFTVSCLDQKLFKKNFLNTCPAKSENGKN